MKDEEVIQGALEVLRKGGVILYPTDTIWGIGCDATNPKAIDKIYKVKNRPHGKGLIVLVDSIESLCKYVVKPSPITADLIKAAKNPLSIIYKEGLGEERLLRRQRVYPCHNKRVLQGGDKETRTPHNIYLGKPQRRAFTI